MDEVAGLYATDFIAASPGGLTCGKNDAQLQQTMAEGYARYRAMGTLGMQVRDVAVTPIDDCHCLARVAWTASYARVDLPRTTIDFDVHYLVAVSGDTAKVFGWISGDEEAALKAHGVI